MRRQVWASTRARPAHWAGWFRFSSRVVGELEPCGELFDASPAAMMAVAWLATGAMASSGDPDRRLTVEDLLGLEAFGRADISPDGRWAVYEKRDGYNTMDGGPPWRAVDLDDHGPLARGPEGARHATAAPSPR